jgi:diguanylate cyclase (GGDEF)-like protein
MPQPRRQPVKTVVVTPASNKAATFESLTSALRSTPLGVVLFTIIAYFKLDALPLNLVATIPVLAYITILFGLIITLCFNRSRAFFILLTILLSQLEKFAYIPDYIDRTVALPGIYSMVSLLLPLNFLWFSSISERGILSPSGKRCFTFLCSQLLFAAGLVLSGDKEIFIELDKRFLNWSFMPPTPLPDIAVVAFIITGLLLLVKRRKTDAHFKTTMLCALVVIAFARHFDHLPAVTSLFYTAAGLIIIVSVIQDYYFKAYLDELTGLPARRSLNEELMRLEGSYVIAMVDVDFFKKFNDTYGHDAGDDVLRFIAGIMKNFKDGKSFRYGGEEFTLLFSGKTIDEVLSCLEGLRGQIAQTPFMLRGGGKQGKNRNLHVTVSIGVAEANDKLKTWEDVIKAADAALYRAKEKGRNCVSK